MGFQRETASRGTLSMYTSVCLFRYALFSSEKFLNCIKVVFAILLEFIVFHTTPTPLSIAGAVIIMSSAVYTSVPLHSSLTCPVLTS